MVKRIFQAKLSSAAGLSRLTDSHSDVETPGAETTLGEVAAADLNDLFSAVISRVADWLVQPPVEPGVVLSCVQALKQLHLTAANELLRLQQQLDGRP